MKPQIFQEIADELERRVRTGAYARGSALPSRNHLVAEFKSSRVTVDRAIRVLVHRGILTSRHGSGTFVSGEDVKYRVAFIGANCDLQLDKLDVVQVSASRLAHRSEWSRLLEYSGVIFSMPEAALVPLVQEIARTLPTVAVNRILPGVPYVSTDFRGAYREITRERMAACPQARVFFLRSMTRSLAISYREEGFLDACREAQKFYEIIDMPNEFEGRLEVLERALRPGGPMILVSDALNNTGSVMHYAMSHHLEWGRDISYSDFDNDYPSDVWGVAVTSFLQDFRALHTKAAQMLLDYLENGTRLERLNIPPLRRNGDT
ncbi:MAG: GntR family transcriptional regulator [Victivallales bacterium]|nr:GntR family transcriptional regulator [Victivallales bacterium]